MRKLTLVLLMAFTCVGTIRSQENIDGWARESKFTFKGTIKKLEATTLASIQPTKETAVVSVDDVLQAPDALRAFAGKDITVLLKKGESFKVDEQWVFFTAGWLYGESLGVREIGRAPAGQNLPALSEQIKTTVQRSIDQELQKRLSSATLVVLGKVLTIKPAPDQRRNEPVSEHSPDWWQAEVEIDSVEKGNFPEKRVTVLYPNSTDEFWYDAPKFHPGEEGVWILRREQPAFFVKARMEGFTALHSGDFHPKEDVSRIRQAIKSVR